MIDQTREKVKKHIKTHSERSVEDRDAISLLGTFLNPGGRINTSFAANDTWPNHDGTFDSFQTPMCPGVRSRTFLFRLKAPVYTQKKTESSNIL